MKEIKIITYYCPIGKHKWTSEEWTDKDPQEIVDLECGLGDSCRNKPDKGGGISFNHKQGAAYES